MVNSCRKGKDQERELANKLSEHIGVKLERNLEQQRSGGYDLVGLPALAIEVKSHKTLKLPEWWRQCCEQAFNSKRIPVLAYKVYRKGWRVRMPLSALGPWVDSWELQDTADISLEGFGKLVREKWLDEKTVHPLEDVS